MGRQSACRERIGSLEVTGGQKRVGWRPRDQIGRQCFCVHLEADQRHGIRTHAAADPAALLAGYRVVRLQDIGPKLLLAQGTAIDGARGQWRCPGRDVIWHACLSICRYRHRQARLYPNADT
jgi:hypothetical protein